MKTIAELIGEEPDAAIEAVAAAFRSELGRHEQMELQRLSTPEYPIVLAIDRRREEWRSAKAIIEVYERALDLGAGAA